MKMLVDVLVDRLQWAVVSDFRVCKRGVSGSFNELRAVQLALGVESVFIDDGFRTAEVRSEAAKYDEWKAVRRVIGRRTVADEIAEVFQ